MLRALKTRDFRLLWVGQTVSALGEQFHLVALPWLVLQLTRDPLQIGIVLAVSSIPRALLMLVGGVWADRISPRTIVLASDVTSAAVTAVLAVAVLAGEVRMWMVYAMALVLGLVGSFFIPAVYSLVPRLLPHDQLAGGNALMQGGAQFARFVGPVASGVLIAAFGAVELGGEQAASLHGIGVSFTLDSVTFALAALALWMIRPMAPVEHDHRQDTLHSLAEGLRYAWSRSDFRWIFIIVAMANVMLSGPLMVGLPVLADTRLPEGAAAFGLILSALGGGNVVGILVAGWRPCRSGRLLGGLVVGMFTLFGLTLAGLVLVSATWQAMPLLALVGAGNGYVIITMLSLLGRRAAPAMLGRVMSMLMLATYGLAPVSQLLAGALARQGIVTLFVGAGVGLIATAVVAATRPEVWSFGDACVDAPIADSGAGCA